VLSPLTFDEWNENVRENFIASLLGPLGYIHNSMSNRRLPNLPFGVVRLAEHAPPSSSCSPA